MGKKKYHGGLKLSLLLLFITLLSMFSTCYASQPSLQEMTDFIDLIKVKQESGELINFNKITGDSSSIASDFLSITSDVDFSLDNVAYFSIGQIKYNTSSWANNTNPTQGAFIIGNGGMGNQSLEHIYITVNNNGSAGFNVVFKNGSPTRPTFYYINGSHCYKLTLANTFYSSATNLQYSLNSAQSVVTNNLIFTKYKTFSIYSSFNYGSSYIPVLNNFNGITYEEFYTPPEPPEPENTTGNITNNSGEKTGSIDLSGIENGITNIQNQISGDTQKIIDNQNQNTEEIVGAINNANESYWGSGDDLNEEDFEDSISDSLNGIMSDLSGEFSKNAIFSEMENAEDIFLDFFRNQEDESFYDLIISWDSISPIFSMYNGSEILSSAPIISGDSINLSALCRNNQTLGTIQQYIRIIFNFSCTIALIWQIYNLVLSTLGIDNPYLYEDSQVNDVVNSDTGELHTYIRSRRRIFKKWW